MKSDSTKTDGETNNHPTLSSAGGKQPLIAAGGPHQTRDVRREFPGFLIRLVGEEQLRRLPDEPACPRSYD